MIIIDDYPPEKFPDAWKAFIRNAGCTNITPFKKEESEVSKIELYYLFGIFF